MKTVIYNPDLDEAVANIFNSSCFVSLRPGQTVEGEQLETKELGLTLINLDPSVKYTGFTTDTVAPGVKQFQVVRVDDEKGLVELRPSSWLRPELQPDSGLKIKVYLYRAVKGGLIGFVENEKIRVFLPSSHAVQKNLRKYEKKTIEVTVVSIDKDNNSIIVSEEDPEKIKEARQAEAKAFSAKIDKLKDKVLTGVVKGRKDYGVFVSCPEFDGREGLLHISEYSVKNISLPKTGEEIEFKVVGYNKKKLSLSRLAIKEVFEAETDSLNRKAGLMSGKVENYDERFGAFVKVDGYRLTGLLHKNSFNEESWTDGNKATEEGAQVLFWVSRWDPETKKLSLTQKGDSSVKNPRQE